LFGSHGRETWSHDLKQKMVETKARIKIFEAKKDKVRGDRRKVYSEECRNF
jgi:hypothetical protein